MVDFDGALIMNNSNQHVVSITTIPPMEQVLSDDGEVHLRYRGEMETGTLILKGTALVDVSYDTDITSDPALPSAPLADSSSNLTIPDDAIKAQAGLLSEKNSTLSTVRDLVSYVHDGMAYDLSYWGRIAPAKEVFKDRRGVCVEYTHLLISMADSLGLKARYVSGFVYGASWQPHAWADIEVPGQGWLPADATFGQVGILDSSHVALSQGADQTSAYDLLLSDKPGATLDVSDSIGSVSSSMDLKGSSIELGFDNSTYTVSVKMRNDRSDYVFGAYDLSGQNGFISTDRKIVLLPPKGEMRRFYGLNRSLFQEGYVYTIPLGASLNDATAQKTVRIEIPAKPGPAAADQDVPQCLLPLILLFIASLAVLLPHSIIEFTRLRRKHLPSFLKKSSAYLKEHGSKDSRGRRRP